MYGHIAEAERKSKVKHKVERVELRASTSFKSILEREAAKKTYQ